MYEYGLGGSRALEYKTTKNLARLNWWTIEFGLIRKAEGLKIYGAGLCGIAYLLLLLIQSSARAKREAY